MATPLPGIWGIDLGQCALKAIRVELRDGKPTATAFDYVEHPKILSQPDADPDQLAREALEKFLSRNTLKGDTVVISVPGQSGLARFVKLPPVEEKKINDIVKFEAKQQIPFPLEEVVWDYQKLGEGEVSDGFALETEIGLFAMKRDMVYRALEQYKDVNVEVNIIQMAPLALCNFIGYDLLNKGKDTPPAEDDEDETECIVALDIGADNSNLVITDGEKIIWQRPIPLGGNHFTRALTKELKLTFAKAEHVKRNAIKSPDLRKILTALRPVLNDFVNEVQRSLGYFTNTHRKASVTYMVGLGNAFRLPGLQKFLQEKLGLEVRKLQKFERLGGEEVTKAPQFTENVMSFAVAYGLALQGHHLSRLQTNLLPHEIHWERMIRAKKPWAVAAAAALVLAIGSLAFQKGIQYRVYKNPEVDQAVKAADAVIQRKNTLDTQFMNFENKAKDSKIAVNRIASGVEERFNWNLFYTYINHALPQPDGTQISSKPQIRRLYYDKNEDAQRAYRMWNARKFLDPMEKRDPVKEQKDLEYIKKNLIQINIEGIGCMYSDNLKETFFPNIAGAVLKGRGIQEATELKYIKTEKDKLPEKGWVFEIRGYTYFELNIRNVDQFIVETFVENLRNPVTLPGDDEMKKQMLERIQKNIGYVFLYKDKKVEDPEPGYLHLANQSQLPNVLTASAIPETQAPRGGAPTPVPTPEMAMAPKGNWAPLGEIARATFGAGGGGGRGERPTPSPNVRPKGDLSGLRGEDPNDPNKKPTEVVPKQPRVEFVVLFVWQEPTTIGEDETTDAPQQF